MRLLIIEDDEAIADELREGLLDARYEVDVASTGTEGLEKACEIGYDLILLDIMLPGIDGWEICRRLRARKDTTPILMLTARDAPPDRVRGLDTGADDYLPKPFDFPELLARVRALLRRNSRYKARVIHTADLEIDTAARRVSREGNEIVLTDREYTLLEALVTREGRPLTREFIQEQIWRDDSALGTTVDTWVYLLRKKIDGDRPTRLIQTVHGVGYVFRSGDDRDI
ncbi:MAG: response regulator transcription factor [Armatimonas sp.]